MGCCSDGAKLREHRLYRSSPLDRAQGMWVPPAKELMKLTLEQKIAHGGHPVLRWNMDNIFIRTDPAETLKQIRKSPQKRLMELLQRLWHLMGQLGVEIRMQECVWQQRYFVYVEIYHSVIADNIIPCIRYRSIKQHCSDKWYTLFLFHDWYCSDKIV